MFFTAVSYVGKQTSKCGYCKNERGSVAHGMQSYQMLPLDYQDLIDRGWRRSGHYCYKPENSTTCCPCYAIRCDTTEFKLSKTHKRVLKRMNRFLRDGKKGLNEKQDDAAGPSTSGGHDQGGDAGGSIRDEPRAPNVALPIVDWSAVSAANVAAEANLQEEEEGNEVPADSTDSSEKSYTEDGSHLPCKKAKQMRRARHQVKLEAKGTLALALTAGNANQEKTLTQFTAYPGSNDKHKLRIVLVPSNRPPSDEEFRLYRKYQLTIHNDDPQRITPTSLQRFCYKSPLKFFRPADGPSPGYGSFHQQYWLDDKLIAVGVIDILPYCISAVYFFYDPDYSFLSLGTYGSLREIELVQQLAHKVPALKYYYMGYYIHSCPKMRYKGKLTPSYLLCPETYVFTLLTDAMRAKLDDCKYQRLNADPDADDANAFAECHLDKVLVLKNYITYTYDRYIQLFSIKKLDNMLDIIMSRISKELTGEIADRETILEYGKLVGKICAHRLMYVKSDEE